MSTDSKSHVSSPVFHPDPIPVQVPISATSNIIVLLSDTVTHLSEDLTRARQDTAQAHYTLGQATQQHFAQYADVSGQRTVLQNQLNDCYTNIVGFLNLAAGYTHNIAIQLKELQESIRKWAAHNPVMPVGELRTSEQQLSWLREQADVPVTAPTPTGTADSKDNIMTYEAWPTLREAHGEGSRPRSASAKM